MIKFSSHLILVFFASIITVCLGIALTDFLFLYFGVSESLKFIVFMVTTISVFITFLIKGLKEV